MTNKRIAAWNVVGKQPMRCGSRVPIVVFLLLVSCLSTADAARRVPVRASVRFEKDGNKVYAVCLIVNDGDNPVGVGDVSLSWHIESGINASTGGNDINFPHELSARGLFRFLQAMSREDRERGRAWDDAIALERLRIVDSEWFLDWFPKVDSTSNIVGDLTLDLCFCVLTTNTVSHQMEVVPVRFVLKMSLSTFAWNKWIAMRPAGERTGQDGKTAEDKQEMEKKRGNK